MKRMLFGITWASAQNSIWLLGYGLLIALLVYATISLAKSLNLLASSRWQKTFLSGFSVFKMRIKACLFGVGLLFLFITLLQPQWGTKEELVLQEGRELLVALDISRSMMAADVKPNRLTFAKSKIKKLIQLLHAERVGLLVFSGDAFIQCPLTRDTAALSLFLDNVDAETISSGTTSIAQAISKALDTFASLPARKNKMLVIFTDGEDFSSGLSEVKSRAQEMGLHIFTYGVGTEEGAPVPIITDTGAIQGYQKDDAGKVIFSRLNPGILQALSKESGGKYIGPTQGSEDLQQLVEQVELYEKEKFEDKELHTEEERYPYFLAVAFACFLIEWLL